MTTLNQLVKKQQKRIKKKHTVRTTALRGDPQRKATCLLIKKEKPKKPNSANRKVLRVFFYVKKQIRKNRREKVKVKVRRRVRVHAPTEAPMSHYNKYQRMILRGCRVRDLPGVRYRPIFGLLDIRPFFGKVRRKYKRSKYSLPRIGNENSGKGRFSR